MQEHLISNFTAHTKTGHLLRDNVSRFAKNIIEPAEGKMITQSDHSLISAFVIRFLKGK